MTPPETKPKDSKETSVPSDTKDAPFDINLGANGVLFPPTDSSFFGSNIAIKDVASYAQVFTQMFGGDTTETPIQAALRGLGVTDRQAYNYEAAKALNTPPSAFAYGRISFAPDTAVNGGIIQWPGINPDALKKICRENVAPQLIIGMRVDDVMRYSELSDQLWRPGWRIEPRDKHEKQTDKLKGEIKTAETFLLNCNIETGDTSVRKRDQAHITSLKEFLSLIVRDTLIFDGIAVWTDMDGQDRVKAFAALPAGNIRLTTRDGYEGNPNNFAVAVDEGGTVIQAFTRDQLTFYTRNARTDPEAASYGYAEVEIAVRIISAFQAALDINADVFSKSSMANGILTISGNAVTARQLDLLNRMFTNMKKGVTKWWALPVMGLPDGAKLELLDLSRLKGNEAYYKEFMNMLAGALCTIYRFPVRRLGYRISGGHHDATPPTETTTTKIDEDDPGLSPLLGHLETLINEYILWTRWPHLKFSFCGASPAEDAREFEWRSLSKTWDEKRKEARLPSLEETAPKELKLLAKVMGMAPSDPNLAGIYQNLAAAFLEPEGEGENGNGGGNKENHGNRMTSKIDPARSMSHGHAAGTRRDSAAESKG